MKNEIYLDNAATTPVKKEVVKEMEKYLVEEYGNPSSTHEKGERARKAIDEARKKIAIELNCKAHEIYFTSGATESNNLALQGLCRAWPKKKKILISAIEHPSIIKPCEFLAEQGYKIIKIPVNNEGLVDVSFIEREIEKGSANILLVSVMHVNNVIGTIQPIREIGKLCKSSNILFHTDASQSFGKLRINVNDWGIDLLSASSHKIRGPKGIGFLYVREGTKIFPLIFGGGQERGLRSGTENVSAIMGFAKALEIQKKADKKKIEELRNLLIEHLEKLGGRINGSKEKRIYNNINFLFENLRAEDLVLSLSQKNIFISTGSACESRRENENYVLKEIEKSQKEISGSIRIVINEETTQKEIKKLIQEINNFKSSQKQEGKGI